MAWSDSDWSLVAFQDASEYAINQAIKGNYGYLTLEQQRVLNEQRAIGEAQERARLEAENARLRAEIGRLKDGKP